MLMSVLRTASDNTAFKTRPRQGQEIQPCSPKKNLRAQDPIPMTDLYEFPDYSSTVLCDEHPMVVPEQIIKIAVIVMSVGVVSCCLLMWHMADGLVAQLETRDDQWQEFCRETVDAMQDLTHAVDSVNSSEQSLVRFRFRSPVYQRPPRHSTWFEVTSRDNSSISRNGLMQSKSDLGLLPPGQYHLSAESSIYQLDWDFDVYPGAPVDRVVVVPALVPHSDVRIQIQRCGEVEQSPRVCLVRARPIVLDGWTWRVKKPLAIVADARISSSELSQVIAADPLLQLMIATQQVDVMNRLPFLEAEVLSVHCLAPCDAVHAECGDVNATVCYEFGGGLSDVLSKMGLSTQFNRLHVPLPEPVIRWSPDQPRSSHSVSIPSLLAEFEDLPEAGLGDK